MTNTCISKLNALRISGITRYAQGQKIWKPSNLNVLDSKKTKEAKQDMPEAGEP
jgi:hypothetical protein